MKYLLQRKLTNIIIAMFLFVLSSCVNKENTSIKTEVSGTPVKVNNPVITDLTEYLYLNANTIFLNKEIVRSAIQGNIIKNIRNIGDKVLKGDSLFIIKTREYSVSDTLLNLMSEKIFNGNVVIKSETEGIISEVNFQNGGYVSEGEQIAVISDPSSMFIVLNVPYQYVNQININVKCEIKLPDERIFNASIYRIFPSIDFNSQTQKYLLKTDSKIDLPENLNVNARVPIKNRSNIVAVNKKSILSNETISEFWLMKLIDDSTAIRVNVEKGIENDSLVQVVNPNLNLSDRIIYSGSYGLQDTAKVTVE